MNQMQRDNHAIPARFVGLVIGRGGEQIKRLQQDSGCRISIDADNGSDERNCQISGQQHQIDDAKRMLDDLIRRGVERENSRRNDRQYDRQ